MSSGPNAYETLLQQEGGALGSIAHNKHLLEHMRNHSAAAMAVLNSSGAVARGGDAHDVATLVSMSIIAGHKFLESNRLPYVLDPGTMNSQGGSAVSVRDFTGIQSDDAKSLRDAMEKIKDEVKGNTRRGVLLRLLKIKEESPSD
eukprot:g18589.t1